MALIKTNHCHGRVGPFHSPFSLVFRWLRCCLVVSCLFRSLFWCVLGWNGLICIEMKESRLLNRSPIRALPNTKRDPAVPTNWSPIRQYKRDPVIQHRKQNTKHKTPTQHRHNTNTISAKYNSPPTHQHTNTQIFTHTPNTKNADNCK